MVAQFPQTLPANSVVGRLGLGPGPSEAIPLIDLAIALTTSQPFLSPEQFGATDPSVDSFIPFAACISAALAQGAKIVLSSRVYLTSQTLDFQDLEVEGNAAGTIIKALTNNILVVKNSDLLSNVEIDGDNKALWGWLVTLQGGFSPSAVRAFNVNVINCTEYGMVLDSLQNNTFIGTFCQTSAIANIVLANGLANCKFFNCTINSNLGALPGACNLLLLNDTSNPHGFGLSNTGGSIRHVSFFGGIMERTVTENIRTLNPAAFGSPGGEINFHDYEFDGKTQITFDSTYNGTINFFNCALQGDGSGAALASGAGNGANVFFWNTPYNETPSGYNSAGIDMGMTCNNNLSKLLNFSMANFANNVPFASGGITSATYNSATRTIAVVTTAGSGQLDFVNDNAAAIGWRSDSMDRLPLLRISFSVSALVAAADINLLIIGSSTNLGNFAAGSWSVLYRGQATDTGTIRFRTNGVGTGWSLSNVSIEYL